jgi:hypothetical protein
MAKKSNVMVAGRSRSGKLWKLGQECIQEGASYSVNIEEAEEYKYLGVKVSLGRNTLQAQWTQVTKKARQLAGWVRCDSKDSCNPTLLGSMMWTHIAKPAVLYGTDVYKLGKTALKEVQRSQNRLGRRLLGLSDRCPEEVVHGELGWKYIQEEIDESRLRYLKHIIDMGEEKWTRQVAVASLRRPGTQKTSWWNDTISLLARYKIDTTLCFTGGKDQWKGLIGKQIRNWFDQQWRESLLTKPSLKIYQGREQRHWNYHLGGDGSSKLMIRCMAGDMTLDARRAKYTLTVPLCKMCLQAKEDECHLVNDCEVVAEERQEMLGIIQSDWEGEEHLEWQLADSVRKVQILLGIQRDISKREADAIKIFLVKAVHRRKAFLDLRGQILGEETTLKPAATKATKKPNK